jgi:hypothetical protein
MLRFIVAAQNQNKPRKFRQNDEGRGESSCKRITNHERVRTKKANTTTDDDEVAAAAPIDLTFISL